MNPHADQAAAERRAADAQGRMYAPTIGLDVSAYIDDGCPRPLRDRRRVDVGRVRRRQRRLTVRFSDCALIDFMRIGNNAIRELLRRRGVVA